MVKYSLSEEWRSKFKSEIKRIGVRQKDLPSLSRDSVVTESSISKLLSGQWFDRKTCQPIVEVFIETIFDDERERTRDWREFCISDAEPVQKVPPHNLPQISIALVERNAEIAQLAEMLQQSQSGIAAITGLPGVGKSALALHYAREQLAAYGGGICWVDAREQDVAATIVQFARNNNVSPPDGEDPFLQLNFCWRQWPSAPAPILIILDDLADLALLSKIRSGINERIRFLVTSRQRLEQIPSIALEPLSPEGARQVFTETLPGDPRLSAEQETLQSICSWLGYLPLGLQLVRHYLAQIKSESLAEVFTELQTNALADPALMQADPLSHARYGAAAAFDLSWEHLSDAAKTLGCLVSLFAPPPIPKRLIDASAQALMSSRAYRQAVLQLEQRYLFQYDGDKQTYQMNRLVSSFFRGKLATMQNSEDCSQAVMQNLIEASHLFTEFPSAEDLIQSSAVAPHVEQVMSHFADMLKVSDKVSICRALSQHYVNQGLLSKAWIWAERGVTEALSPESTNIVASIQANTQAAAIAMRLYAKDALTYLEQAIAQQTELNGSEGFAMTEQMILKAAILRSRGDLDAATTWAERALRIRQQHPETTELALAEAQLTLGTIYNVCIKTGKNCVEDFVAKNPDIESLLRNAVEIRRQTLPESDMRLPEALDQLAKFHMYRGEYDEAFLLVMEAHNINESVLPEHHLQIALGANNLAKVEEALERYEDAELHYRQAISIFQDAEIVPLIVGCQYNLGKMLSEIDKADDARIILQQAQQNLAEKEPDSPLLQQVADLLNAVHQG